MLNLIFGTHSHVGAELLGCVYRKPKPGHSGDEGHQGSGVN
jgi:hypothetical protein